MWQWKRIQSQRKNAPSQRRPRMSLTVHTQTTCILCIDICDRCPVDQSHRRVFVMLIPFGEPYHFLGRTGAHIHVTFARVQTSSSLVLIETQTLNRIKPSPSPAIPVSSLFHPLYPRAIPIPHMPSHAICQTSCPCGARYSIASRASARPKRTERRLGRNRHRHHAPPPPATATLSWCWRLG